MNISLLHPDLDVSYRIPKSRISFFKYFVKWAAKEDSENHVGWIGISITTMTAVFFPLTMTVILFNGAAGGLIVMAMLSLIAVVIVNLASLSTRYTIPFLLAGILTDIIAVIISIL